MSVTELRPALYYPYIDISNEHWLKATLLCAPAVKRIVPANYTPEDIPTIKKYSAITGPSKQPLLDTVPTFSAAADIAQLSLLEELRKHPVEIKAKYHRTKAPAVDEYRIHAAKFNDALLEYLRDQELAWPSNKDNAYGTGPWFALHP
ncbi:MAG: hypothetical protein MN733_33045, partial [Nitrososphaera sp.]|nr:hypothetical protein [Nitrososphaera sp.]